MEFLLISLFHYLYFEEDILSCFTINSISQVTIALKCEATINNK